MGATIVSGGAAYADTGASRNQVQLNTKELHGPEAAEALRSVASERPVRELGRTVGIEPTKAVENGVVEQIPKGVGGKDPQRYVSITWIDGPQELVRTSHFVLPDGRIESNIFRLTKTGPEPTMEYGKLGGQTVTITESQAESHYAAASAQGFIGCLAACLGITSAFAGVIIAGCGLACAVTAGAACIICFAAATGFSAGSVGGCFAGCS